jgi:CRP-like cAMP-binding protein
MTELLFRKFDEKIDLTQEEKQLGRDFFISKKLRKKQYLLQEGDVCKYIAFIEKGLLRSYTVDDKGNEYITQFAFEGWWITVSLQANLHNTTSRQWKTANCSS